MIFILEDITFNANFLLARGFFFSRHVISFFETSVSKGVGILYYLRNAKYKKFQNKAVAYYDC